MPSGLTISRLGFGCASLLTITSSKARQRLLAEAYELGIRHFDVARLYGLGAAEGELGRFASSRRDGITIATKFGIESAPGAARMARFQRPARALLNGVPAVQRLVRRHAETFLAPRLYDSATARRSLETSLAELSVECVDLLFVHDPRPKDEVDAQDLLSFFEELKAAGTIAAWGVSQDAHPEFDIIGRLGSSAILQARDDVFDRVVRSEPMISFGVFGRAFSRIDGALRTDSVLHRHWSDRLGGDPLADDRLAGLVLAEALAANPHGAVLYSTVRPQRLAVASAALASPPSQDTVNTFRQLVRTSFPRVDGRPGNAA